MSLSSTSSSSPSNSKSIADQSAATRDNDHDANNLQIFLGGSCNPTTWRRNDAIPYLESNGISYYNPQVDNWTPEAVNSERHAKQNAQLLLFVIDKQTRSTVSLVESAFIAGDIKNLVLVIYPFEYDVISLTDTCKQAKQSSGIIKINDEVISFGEFQELKQARCMLQNLLIIQNIPMFSDIHQALKYISYSLSGNGNGTKLQQKTLYRFRNASEPTSQNLQQIPHSKTHPDQQHVQQEQNPQDSPITIKSKLFNQESIDEMKSKNDMTTDIYLSSESDDQLNVESTIISILREKGLTYHNMSVNNIIKSSHNPPRLIIPKLSIDSQKSTSSATIGTKELMEYSTDAFDSCADSTKLAIEKEICAIRSSRVILFVITNKCRGLSIMVLASHFMALFRNNVVLCVQYLEEPCSIDGETLTKTAIADYNRGRVYLCDYAIKSQVPVFSSIGEAIDCCSRRCRHNPNKN